jgi:hypothetical protein
VILEDWEECIKLLNMRDAVNIVGKIISIKELNYLIDGVYFLPNLGEIYVKLKKPDGVTINYNLQYLLPFIKEQIKL